MRYLLVFGLILLLVFSFHSVYAANYYVASSGDDNNPGTGEASPWKTLEKLNTTKFKPGDVIHFNRGDEWIGKFAVTESGSADNPITITSYGEGPLPKLSNPKWDYDWDGVVIKLSGAYIVVQKIHFINGPVHPYESNKARHENVYDMGAVNMTRDSEHCTVQYCDVEDYPIGIQSQGKYNKIYQNYFHDCNKGMCLPYWGPIAIFDGGLHDEISYNYIINYKGGGSGGFDGGAIEIDHFMWGKGHIGYGADSIKVHHNIGIENAGFLEPEAVENTRGNNYLEVYSNFSDDYKWFISDSDLHNSTIRNNTSLRVLPWKKPVEFVLIIQGVGNKVFHNVFVMANTLTAFSSEMEMERKNNIYYSHDKSVDDPVGIKKNDSDIIATDWKKFSPYLYSDTGEILSPRPDENGVIKAWVPTDNKYEFESFTITLPK